MHVRPVREDDGRAGLRDGELLGRDLLEGVAEHVGVLEPDVRQQDDARAKHVRRVVPAAETRLDHCDVDGGVREGCERGRGDRFELRRAELLRGGADAADCGLEVRLPSFQPDPLGPAYDVRRDRRADTQSFGEEQLLDRHRGRRLAVRPDDVDRRVRELRVPDRGEQRAHAVEPEAVARPRAHRVEPLDGGHPANRRAGFMRAIRCIRR